MRFNLYPPSLADCRRMAALVMAEYAEAFDSPSTSTAPHGGTRGGFGRGSFRGVGLSGGFVRAGGNLWLLSKLTYRLYPCCTGATLSTAKRTGRHGLLEGEAFLLVTLLTKSPALRPLASRRHHHRPIPSQMANERWTNSYRRSRGMSKPLNAADVMQ